MIVLGFFFRKKRYCLHTQLLSVCAVSRGHQIYDFEKLVLCKLGLLEKAAIYFHNQIIFPLGFLGAWAGALWSFLIAM